MADRHGVAYRAEGSETWTNVFPQRLSPIELLIHGSFAVISLFLLSVPVFAYTSSEPPSWSLIFVNILGALGMGAIGVATLRVSTLDGAGENSIRFIGPGRCVVRTRFFAEPLVLVGFTMLTFGLMALVFWIWDPYSYLPWGSGNKHSLMPFVFAGGMMSFAFLAGSRPWRRRLVFTPHALEYRRFRKPISIPWDTIDSLEPKDEGVGKTVTVTMRPPGQPPTLERKYFPNGTAQGKLAIHCMSVDPGTIYYALNRLWREPETRHLLETPEGAHQLFTGPPWRERIHMTRGQTWTPPATSS